MTQRGPYLSHLRDAIEDYDVSLFVLAPTLRFMQPQPKTCNEHNAVNNKNVFHRGFDATGIGAIACLQHGKFCLGSVVDFQKGERCGNYFLVDLLI